MAFRNAHWAVTGGRSFVYPHLVAHLSPRDELPPSIARGENTIWALAACGKSGGLSSDLYFTRCVTFYDFILCALYTRFWTGACSLPLFNCLCRLNEPRRLFIALRPPFRKIDQIAQFAPRACRKKWLWGDAEIYRRIARRAKWSTMMMVFTLVRAKWLWRVCCGSDTPYKRDGETICRAKNRATAKFCLIYWLNWQVHRAKQAKTRQFYY